MNNATFGITIENVRKHRNINNRKVKKLFIRAKLSYYKVFHRRLISNRNEKNSNINNKPVYLGWSITEDIYKDVAEDVETRFDISNFDLDRPLPKEKNRKVIGLMKDELRGKIMNRFVGLRAKTYTYLKYNNDGDKKSKATKNYVIKRKLRFQDYKNCLEAAQIENKIS